MSEFQIQNLKLENIKVWFKCMECQGHFYALPLLEEHFLEEHKGKRFILPKDLPSGAREGKLIMKNRSLPEPPKNKEVNSDICRKSFKTRSALNFHRKKLHQPNNASEINTKSEMKLPSEPCIQQSDMNSEVDQNHRSVLTTTQKATDLEKVVVKTTTTKNNMQRAVNTNYVYSVKNGMKLVCCRECPFQTTLVTHYKSHLRLHEKGSTTVICSLCGWFVNPQRLKLHCRIRHTSVVKNDLV